MENEAGDSAGYEKVSLPVKKKKNLLWLWILITAIVSGGGVGTYAYRGAISDRFFNNKTETAVTVETPATTATVTEEVSTETASVKIVDEGITWITPRQKLADLKLFAKASGVDGYIGTDYYKVATTSDGGEIILAMVKTEEMLAIYDFHHFLKKGGVYYWLSNNSDKVGGDGDSSTYARTNSEVNNTLKILSLLPDKTITKGSTVLTQDKTSSRREAFVNMESTGTKITETKWGDLYLLKGNDVSETNTSVKTGNYYILRNDGIKIIYTLGSIFRLDDGTLSLTWSNQLGKDQKYSQVVTSKCGNMGGTFPLIVDQTFLSTKTEVGKSSGGAKVYTISADGILADLAYYVYTMDNLSDKISKSEFIANLGTLAWQDDYGNWILFLNDKYMPAVECGKPVIYLYPEKDTNVSVKVGASVRVSEPAYGTGWNVLAQKNGNLVLKNKNYPYLFWEGTGFGTYPSIKSGTVVERSKVAETITSQLSYMGLNQKEIADFNEFWLPKMPNTKYVRLTWLLTEEMNQLAPLSVSPKPDTSIRVFLDFVGLDKKIDIASQTLPKYERKGFTLVEWGGLLVGGK